MALSNWDTAAIDLDGNPVTGVVRSPLGVVVRIYKNWLYVEDAEAYKGGGFTSPVVAHINEGSLVYRDVFIEAVRGPQSGVYVVAWSYRDPNDYKAGMVGMVGCGVHGYDDRTFVGVKPESLQWLQDRLRAKHVVTGQILHSSVYDGVKGSWTDDKIVLNPYDVWDWDVPDSARQLDVRSAVRFNQGDAFFASHVGFDIPGTSAGDAQPTIMSQMLKPTEEAQ
jgi:hypothetical protein